MVTRDSPAIQAKKEYLKACAAILADSPSDDTRQRMDARMRRLNREIAKLRLA